MHYLANFLDFTLFEISGQKVQVTNLLTATLIILAVIFIYKLLVKYVLKKILAINSVDQGRQYAATQLIKYVFFLLAATLILDNIGIDISLLLAGSAALLIGVGIGLQHTFNDLVSGLILLFEGSVQVGDIVNVNEMVGTVNKIGLRTSIVETRDNIRVIVPNSKFISENVINWSHNNSIARFEIKLGVAYGSDLKLVEKCLLKALDDNPHVLEAPGPDVQFVNFGDSALEFEMYFWSRNFWGIEKTKSNLRFAIDEVFRENGIEIPFPQRDMHIRSGQMK